MESCTLILNARKPNWNTGRLEHLGNPRKHAHIVTPRRKRSWMTVFFLEWPTEYHRENWVFNSERRKVPPYVKIPRVTHESKLGTHFFSQKHGQIKNVQLTDLLFPEHQVPKTYSLKTAIVTDRAMHSVQDKKDGNGKWWEILRLAEWKPSSIFIILTTYCASPSCLRR